jgi:hypothetical protein
MYQLKYTSGNEIQVSGRHDGREDTIARPGSYLIYTNWAVFQLIHSGLQAFRSAGRNRDVGRERRGRSEHDVE